MSFMAGGQGEWSDATSWMSPAINACQSASRSSRIANRRRAFVLRGAVGDLFGGKRQIVRACLRRDRQTARARLANQPERLRRRQMNDVHRARKSSIEPDEQANGLDLGLRRSRCQVGRIRPRSAAGTVEKQRRHPRRAPSAGRRRRARIGSASRRSLSATFGNSSTPDGDRKHLKARTPASHSASSSLAFPGTTPPMNSTLTVALPRRGLAFGTQRLHRRRRRNGVQRHVENRRDAARRRRARRSGETLPLGAARLVHMHVRVDDARPSRRASPTSIACSIAPIVVMRRRPRFGHRRRARWPHGSASGDHASRPQREVAHVRRAYCVSRPEAPQQVAAHEPAILGGRADVVDRRDLTRGARSPPRRSTRRCERALQCRPARTTVGATLPSAIRAVVAVTDAGDHDLRDRLRGARADLSEPLACRVQRGTSTATISSSARRTDSR